MTPQFFLYTSKGAFQAERVLLDMGDRVTDMLRANRGASSAASALMDASRALRDSHAENGQVLL
jgi:hypothetical protein